MKAIARLACVSMLLLASPLWAAKEKSPGADHWFEFDKADEIIPTTHLENPLFYDAAVAPAREGLWVTWLEFQPGKGDQLWVGLQTNGAWALQKQLSTAPGDYANPTPTIDADGKLWLTF